MFKKNAKNAAPLVTTIKTGASAVVRELETITAGRISTDTAAAAATSLAQGMLATMIRRLDAGLRDFEAGKSDEKFRLAYGAYLEIGRCLEMAREGASSDAGLRDRLSKLRRERFAPVEASFKDLLAQ